MSNLHARLQALIHDLKTPELERFRQRSKELKEKNAPRNQFIRWRDSKSGKEWKQQELERINGRCQCCQKSFSKDNLVIDHIQSIAEHPELATVITNFQILCHGCNQSKGTH